MTLRMHAKSSAKLGKRAATRGEEWAGEAAKYGGQAAQCEPAQAATSGSWCRTMAADPTPSASQPAHGNSGRTW